MALVRPKVCCRTRTTRPFAHASTSRRRVAKREAAWEVARARAGAHRGSRPRSPPRAAPTRALPRHISRAAGEARHRLGVGKALRRHDAKVRQSHGLHRARGAADVTRMARSRKHDRDARAKGRFVHAADCAGIPSKIAESRRARPAAASSPTPLPCIPCSTRPSRPRARRAASSAAPPSTWKNSPCAASTRNDFVSEVDHAAEEAIIAVLRGSLSLPRHPRRGRRRPECRRRVRCG